MIVEKQSIIKLSNGVTYIVVDAITVGEVDYYMLSSLDNPNNMPIICTYSESGFVPVTNKFITKNIIGEFKDGLKETISKLQEIAKKNIAEGEDK